MADVNKAVKSWGKSDPVVGRFFSQFAGETDAERKAREAREEAVRMAKDDLELKKAVAAGNNATAQGAINKIEGQASDDEIMQVLTMLQNGASPEEISAQMGYGGDQGYDYSAFGGGKPAPGPSAPAGSAMDRLQQRVASQGVASKPTEAPTSASGPFMSRGGKTVSSAAFGKRAKPAYEDTHYIDKGAVQTGVDTLGDAAPAVPEFRQAYDNYGSPTGPTPQEQAAAYYAANPQTQYTTQGGVETGRVAPDGGSVSNTRSLSDFSPEQIAKAKELANAGRWSQKGEYDKIFKARTGIYEQLKSKLDAIQDPEAKAALAPVVNAAFRSDATKASQQDALSKLNALTGIKETAEERLMREVARRNQENQMGAQRKATMANLAARGQLGSGAELANMLGAQASTSSNRVLEEMSANANAQKRAIDALGKYGDMGLQLGNQDITEGAQANQTNQFNNNLTEQHNQFVTKNQQQNKHDQTARAGTIADAAVDVANTGERHVNNLTSTIGNNAALKMGTATAGVNLTSPASSAYAGKLVDEATRKADEEAAKPGAFNIGNL
jgi:hypothetical protein